MLSKMKNVSILNKDPVQDGKYNYHNFLQTHLVEGILAVGARKKWLKLICVERVFSVALLFSKQSSGTRMGALENLESDRKRPSFRRVLYVFYKRSK